MPFTVTALCCNPTIRKCEGGEFHFEKNQPLHFSKNNCNHLLSIRVTSGMKKIVKNPNNYPQFMKILPIYCGVIVCGLGWIEAQAATLNPLKELTVTQIVGKAEWAPVKSEAMQPLEKGQKVTDKMYVTTDKGSRVELEAADKTTVRIGSQALFRIGDGFREFDLDVGTILLQAPKDFGGGKIQTPQGSAAARGTTFMVTTNKQGAFKASCLESKIDIKLRTGQSLTLRAGQASYMLPGSRLSAPINFDVANTVKTSTMLTGFEKPLASMPQIQTVVQGQERQIEQGKLMRTDRPALEPPAPLGESGQPQDRPPARLADSDRPLNKPPGLMADSNRPLNKPPTMLNGPTNRPMIQPPSRPNRPDVAAANNPSAPPGGSNPLNPVKVQKERREQAVRLLREKDQAIKPLQPPHPPQNPPPPPPP